MKSSLLRKIVIGTFLSVPAISSIISTIHLIDLFNLGNPTWLSILLAVTFELGSIASLLAISVIDRIKTGAIWFIFFILSGLQIIGNVYYTYSFTSDQLLANPTFLTNFMDLFSFITGEEMRDVKIFLSCIIGIPIPLIALFFLKSNIDYLRPTEKKQDMIKSSVISESPKLEEQTKQTDSKEHDHIEQEIESKLDELTKHAQDLGMYETFDSHVEEENPVNSIIEEDEIEEELDDSEEYNNVRRNRKPMISERRSNSISVLHRG
jgi:hypothetical protein